MTPLEIMVELKRLETRCRRATASLGAPAVVYQKIDELRNALGDWATECIVEDKQDEKDKPRSQSDR